MGRMDLICRTALLTVSGAGALAAGLFEDVHVIKWPKGLYGYRGSMGDLILLQDGSLLFSYTHEGIMGIRSTDQGRTWGEPFTLVPNPQPPAQGSEPPQGLLCLLEGRPFKLPEKSVCDECPTKREKKAVASVKRPLEPIATGPLSETRCFMEQGFLCLGPATRAGCAGDRGGPRCVMSYMPCRGCFGPVKEGANPMVDMMSALSSIGLDPKEIPDRAATFNRYVGAQGRLRPAPAKR